MKTVNVSYTQFKSLLVSKALLGQYKESADRYDLFAIEGTYLSWETTILKDSEEGTDFEASHKANYNKPLEVKAGPGRPQRVAASPQPINTTQHWKGYTLTLPQGETSSYIDISFPSMVYLRGGTIHCSESISSSEYLQMDVLLASNNMVLIDKLLDTCYCFPGKQMSFQSPEAMAVPTDFKLRLYLKNDSGASSNKEVHLIAEFFS